LIFQLRTFNALGDKDRILQKLEEVASELEDDMERNGWTGRTVTLKFKLDTYQGGFMSRVADSHDLTPRPSIYPSQVFSLLDNEKGRIVCSA
jgi:hypothetical protein